MQRCNFLFVENTKQIQCLFATQALTQQTFDFIYKQFDDVQAKVQVAVKQKQNIEANAY